MPHTTDTSTETTCGECARSLSACARNPEGCAYLATSRRAWAKYYADDLREWASYEADQRAQRIDASKNSS